MYKYWFITYEVDDNQSNKVDKIMRKLETRELSQMDAIVLGNEILEAENKKEALQIAFEEISGKISETAPTDSRLNAEQEERIFIDTQGDKAKISFENPSKQTIKQIMNRLS